MDISDLVTGCEEDVIADEIYQLASECVLVTVVRPWGVHEFQRVYDDVSCFFPEKQANDLIGPC